MAWGLGLRRVQGLGFRVLGFRGKSSCELELEASDYDA